MGRKPCCAKEGLNTGAWTAHEDKLLVSYIKAHGEGKWRNLSRRAGLKRCGKSCRLRWLNYLRPGIKRGNISDEEEELIIRLHKLLGNRWSLIAGRLPGRTDNEIKNYWNTTLGKRVHRRESQQPPNQEAMVQTKPQRCTNTFFHLDRLLLMPAPSAAAAAAASPPAAIHLHLQPDQSAETEYSVDRCRVAHGGALGARLSAGETDEKMPPLLDIEQSMEYWLENEFMQEGADFGLTSLAPFLDYYEEDWLGWAQIHDSWEDAM